MINTIITYDDNDSELADYFEASFNHLNTELPLPDLNLTSINGLNCIEANINSAIAAFANSNFVFIGVSHGDNDELSTSNNTYVCQNNVANFAGSLFYTAACCTVNVLGPSVMGNGGLAYVGYNGEVDVWEGYHDYFIECENYGIIEFLTTDKTISATVEEMRARYSEAIDTLLQGGFEDKLVAGILVDNREKLVLLGNGNLTRNDLAA